MAKSFKVGDTVKLRAGGPDMSVESAHGEQYQCQWFAGKKLESGWFPTASLVAVVPDSQ